MPPRRSSFIRTDEHEEAVRSIEWVAELMPRLPTDRYLWKWILVALHNAVQGYMVLALWDGNGLRALRDDIAAKWLRAHRSGTPYPIEKLDAFLHLYEKVKTRRGAKAAFMPGATHDQSMRRLNTFRNDFIHFTPKGWSLEVSLLPPICHDTLDLIEFLGWRSPQVLWHKQSHGRRGRSAAFRIRRSLRLL